MSGDSDGRDQRLDILHRVVKEHQIAGAVEDVPPEQRAELTGQDAGPDRRSLLERGLDEIADAGLESYGDLETMPLLHFLSQYPVVPYTYVVSPGLTRGERPSVAKLRDLAAQGYERTVNLCAESPDGDTPLLVRAGSVDDAYAEAERFGCSVPQQKEFICSFGERLQGPGLGPGRYPLRPLGSVQPTPGQRAATLDEVARQEKGQPE